ncbi:MAG: hypothetical protein HW421_2712 [Ignavibacteria bacterium]|nr:hypothetical protein [Ignavibacteria bacterium]
MYQISKNIVIFVIILIIEAQLKMSNKKLNYHIKLFYGFFIFSLLIISNLPLKSENTYYKFYEPINNPESLSYIDSINLFPQKFASGVGCGSKNDPDNPGWKIIADDTGSGVITHIWTQYFQLPDSSFFFKLIIDGELILQMPMEEFFGNNHGLLRFPFYNKYSGCYVSDIQIPYKKSFKISVKRINPAECNLFWAVQWKPLPDYLVHNSFITPDTSYNNSLKSAEEAFKLGEPKIKYQKPYYSDSYLAPGDTAVLANITEPGIINGFYITINEDLANDNNNLQLLFFWDGSPYPAVDVPLIDFFGLGEGNNNLNSFFIKSNSKESWYSTFPMPFRESAVMKIVNNSKNSVPIHSSSAVDHKKIDINKYGYFYAQETKSYPTKISIFHPVAHIKGKGRYVGTFLYVHDNKRGPSFLEGDALFLPDSNNNNFIHYFGTEDYFNGGWYFREGSYMAPFSGCQRNWSMLYRYHALDGIDFNSTMDVDFQHGFNIDFNCNYRTVAFYYKQWTPFWVDHDTILLGSTVQISGSGYQPNENIACKLNSKELSYIQANSDGRFSINAKIPSDLKDGAYYLNVNGTQKPEQLFIIKEPIIQLMKDSVNQQFRWQDSLLVNGYCFKPNTGILLKMNNLELVEKPKTDNNGSFSAYIHIPWIKEGFYNLIATDNSNQIISDSQIEITRKLNFEFEELPIIKTDGIYSCNYNGIGDKLNLNNWSRAFNLLFSPWNLGESITFNIVLPVSDTFRVNLFYGKNNHFGIYSVFIDGRYCMDIDCYSNYNKIYPQRSDSLQLFVSFIEKGEHTIQFICTSNNSKSTGLNLVLDNIEFIPVTQFRELNDTLIIDKSSTNHFSIYQNPVNTFDKYLNVILPEYLTENTYYVLSLYDYLGNLITNLFSDYYIKGVIRTELPRLSASVYFCVLKIYRKDKIEIQSLPLIVND